ncbi:hypothetical protein KR059_006029 [Drosophila kikkawai]|nr:hypothetical protein KR059_006029 [Drosophila kikkawai]
METLSAVPVYEGYIVKMASIVLSHPIDLIRVNIEANAHKHSRLTMRHMLERMSRHGLPGFYYGIDAAVTRCTVQTIISYHLFRNLHQLLCQHPYFIMLQPYNTEVLKALCSLCGGIVATPLAKLSVIRQADLTRGSFQRRNYRRLTSGLKCMFRKGGIQHLFIGWEMNAVSSAVMTGLHKPVSNLVEDLAPRLYKKDNSWVPNLARMALTGSIVNVIMTPIDTLSVMALNHSRYSDFTYKNLCRLVVKKHGYRGFFFGLKPGLISLIPNTVVISVATRLLLNQQVI